MKLTVAKYYTASGRCVQTRIYNHDEGNAVTEVPDSLMKAFKTKNGRTVFDGSAVYPDRFLALSDTSNITKSLIGNFIIFDYASKYRQQHSSIDSVDVFSFTDADFKDFESYLNTESYTYSTQTEYAFKLLKEAATREKYYASNSNEIDKLGKELKHDKAADLKLFKSEIKSFIEKELVTRYYFQTGKYKYMFKHDETIKEALSVLGNATLYNSILKGEGEYKVIGKPKK